LRAGQRRVHLLGIKFGNLQSRFEPRYLLAAENLTIGEPSKPLFTPELCGRDRAELFVKLITGEENVHDALVGNPPHVSSTDPD
jgi:hypothetical protein